MGRRGLSTCEARWRSSTPRMSCVRIRACSCGLRSGRSGCVRPRAAAGWWTAPSRTRASAPPRARCRISFITWPASGRWRTPGRRGRRATTRRCASRARAASGRSWRHPSPGWPGSRPGRGWRTPAVPTPRKGGRSAGSSACGLYEIWAVIALGELELGLGRPEQAAVHFEEQRALLEERGVMDVDVSAIPELVDAYLRLGSPGRCGRARAGAGGTGPRQGAALVAGPRGALSRTRGSGQ